MGTYLCLEWDGIKLLQVFLFLHAFFDYSCNKSYRSFKHNFETVCFFALKERESGLTDLSQRREREATQREVEKLKESIQTLTR
jgi:hypothetical protein